MKSDSQEHAPVDEKKSSAVPQPEETSSSGKPSHTGVTIKANADAAEKGAETILHPKAETILHSDAETILHGNVTKVGKPDSP